ncbi:MAG: FHA domain-containing protein [Anaerolineae bacterium]|nr:FHA domain-containing protein [Anaerolineae bacterium]
MPRFCRHCGKELKNPNAKFCPSCGQTVIGSGSVPEGMGASLTIRVPGAPMQVIKLDSPALAIGRRPDNDIVLAHDYVSGHHGRVEQQNGLWYYTDLGSLNGTYLNAQRVQNAALRDGDTLRIGDVYGNSVSLTFRMGDAAQASGPLSSTVQIGTTALETKSTVMIGRDPQSDIPLMSPTISWQHARIDRVGQAHTITDLNSTNGTFVNRQRIQGTYPLQQGDVVQIGPFKLVYEFSNVQQYEAADGMRLDGVQLVREVGSKGKTKRILSDINISVYPKEFISLVGTSGAGKSTLMKALNGVARADGAVLVNGESLYEHFDIYRTMIGYVPQDDILHKELTVASALRYAAELRLPSDTTLQEREQRIKEVLHQVEMVGHEDTAIGDLSGGQRKRISIAMELLADPKLFFLDEPTSGLDPGLEKKMMYTLRKLADSGRTIVLVTHATANINQCDHVCFLSHGRMVYYGPPREAKQFFAVPSDDFADIYERIDDPDIKTAKQKAEQLEQEYRASNYYHQYVAERQQNLQTSQPQVLQQQEAGPRVNGFRQFGILTRRYFNLVFRDKILRLILLGIMPVLGLLLLVIADASSLVGESPDWIRQDLAAQLAQGKSIATYMIATKSQTLLFMFSLASVLLGLFAAAFEIVKEQSIYARERMVTLRILPYLASKVVVLTSFALIQVLLLLLVVGIKVDFDLPQGGALLPFAPIEMYITLLIAAVAAILMGLFVSAIVPNVNTGIYVLLFALFFQIIFAGAFFQLKGMALKFSNLTLTRWSMEGLGASVDIERINNLSSTRVQPEPVEYEAEMEVEKPDENWEPITVVTETQEIEIEVGPGIYQTVPVSVPTVTQNEMITVTETVTKLIEIDDLEPITIENPREFDISYAREPGHLFKVWGILLGYALLFTILTVLALKRKDVV